MMFSVRRAEFGNEFVFGAATAAYQIEGGQIDGRGSSIWDTFAATPGNVKRADDGHEACDHYHRWREDLDLARDAGFDAYRFSFAWPRIIPDGTGAANDKGLDFYDRLVDGMLERGLKPFATLYHWDLPSALQDRGGWMNPDIAKWFADYAGLIGKRFGTRLHAIATINEPWCIAWLGHFLGRHAPGYRDVRAAARAMHNVLNAHGTAIHALRAEHAKRLGIVLNLEKSEPATHSDADRAAALLGDGIFNRWYLGGLFNAAYPDDMLAALERYLPHGWQDQMQTVSAKLDWLGINYYSRALYTPDPDRPVFPITTVEGPLPKSDLGWEIYPDGLRALLERVAREYTGELPIYVTENGMSENDDTRRTPFYDAHLKAVLAAREAGVDVRGYFAWSLLDNYEWAEGYSSRFGIVHVDYDTQKRTPKGTYRAFQAMLGKR